MKLLMLVTLVGAGVYLRRRPDVRRWLVAMARAGSVLAGYTDPDYGSLQHQVLLGARRQRCVAVNGITRLPTAFRVTFAEADRSIVEPVEAAFFADVAQVLLADAEQRDWVVDRVPRFHAARRRARPSRVPVGCRRPSGRARHRAPRRRDRPPLSGTR